MESVKRGLTDHGVNVVDIGVVTTDMFYFASAAYDYDGGLTITASHNPREYNGMKFAINNTPHGLIKIGASTGMPEIQKMAQELETFVLPVMKRAAEAFLERMSTQRPNLASKVAVPGKDSTVNATGTKRAGH